MVTGKQARTPRTTSRQGSSTSAILSHGTSTSAPPRSTLLGSSRSEQKTPERPHLPSPPLGPHPLCRRATPQGMCRAMQPRSWSRSILVCAGFARWSHRGAPARHPHILAPDATRLAHRAADSRGSCAEGGARYLLPDAPAARSASGLGPLGEGGAQGGSGCGEGAR